MVYLGKKSHPSYTVFWLDDFGVKLKGQWDLVHFLSGYCIYL